MIAVLRGLALPALALLVAGCASFDALSPGDSAQSVEARMGAPAGIWKNPDGSEVWEYPLGPLGVHTYMVTLGPDRAVRQVDQVLSEEYISKLHAGMSRDEVRRLVGKPSYIGYSDPNDEEIWGWRYREWRVRKMELYAQFDRPTGKLKRITRFQIDPSDDRRR